MYTLSGLQRRQPDFPIFVNFPTSHKPQWSPEKHNTKCLRVVTPAGFPHVAAL